VATAVVLSVCRARSTATSRSSPSPDFGRTPESHRRKPSSRQSTAAASPALRALEGHLKNRAFLVGERYSIAEISLYAYAHVANERGFELEPYPAIRSWLARVAAQPGHVQITD
jgi:glutathione S-transferase